MNERDPLVVFGARLASEGILSEVEQTSIQEAQYAVVEEAIEFALASPYPAPEAALDHVFA